MIEIAWSLHITWDYNKDAHGVFGPFNFSARHAY